MSPQTVRIPRSPRSSVEDPAGKTSTTRPIPGTTNNIHHTPQTKAAFEGGRWVQLQGPCRVQRLPSQSGRKGYQYQHNPKSSVHLKEIRGWSRRMKMSRHKKKWWVWFAMNSRNLYCIWKFISWNILSLILFHCKYLLCIFVHPCWIDQWIIP